MVEISASVLGVKKENAIHTFYDLETAKIDYFHIDPMDGKFVESNNLDWMKDYALTISHISNIGLDVHLMVENVESIVDDYLDLKPEFITFHIEATKDEERTLKLIEYIKQNGAKVGIAINPETKVSEIVKYLKYVHMILVMTIVPGKGGQKLIPETLDKVKELKEYITKNSIDINIEVDGGINNITAKDAIERGANILVVGSYLTTAENVKEAVNSLK